MCAAKLQEVTVTAHKDLKLLFKHDEIEATVPPAHDNPAGHPREGRDVAAPPEYYSPLMKTFSKRLPKLPGSAPYVPPFLFLQRILTTPSTLDAGAAVPQAQPASLAFRVQPR